MVARGRRPGRCRVRRATWIAWRDVRARLGGWEFYLFQGIAAAVMIFVSIRSADLGPQAPRVPTVDEVVVVPVLDGGGAEVCAVVSSAEVDRAASCLKPLAVFQRPESKTNGSDPSGIVAELGSMLAMVVFMVAYLSANSTESSVTGGLLDQLDCVASDFEILVGKSVAGVVVGAVSMAVLTLSLVVVRGSVALWTHRPVAVPASEVEVTADLHLLDSQVLGIGAVLGIAHAVGLIFLFIAFGIARQRMQGVMRYGALMGLLLPATSTLVLSPGAQGDAAWVRAMSFFPGLGPGFAVLSLAHGMPSWVALASGAWGLMFLTVASVGILRLGRAYQALGGWPSSWSQWRSAWEG
jgi:hypothetical protein